ncbi:MAG: LysM peptidoglycan-binding domain-containing protein [Planctomycetes bacterium]|nr:LysM peptidoglycan-binding domain-containing protein [Planctomycetota bacterium]
MRIVILLLALVCAFGLAALWQQGRIATLKERQDEARRIAAGQAAKTEVGVVPDGWGVVLVGKPAGDAAAAEPPRADTSGPITEPGPGTQPQQEPQEPAEPADFELVVQPGASLSKLAAAHYGTSKKELVDALARYNGLASANALQAGQTLKLPSPAKLQAFAESR